MDQTENPRWKQPEISDPRELYRLMRLKQPGVAQRVSKSPAARRARTQVATQSLNIGGTVARQLGSASLYFELPVRIQGLANRREHPHARHNREADLRDLAKGATRQVLQVVHGALYSPYTVTLTRFYTKRGRPLDEHDNLRDGFKSIVDGIAAALGVDDGDRVRVEWKYQQEQGAEWGMRAEIMGRIAEEKA